MAAARITWGLRMEAPTTPRAGNLRLLRCRRADPAVRHEDAARAAARARSTRRSPRSLDRGDVHPRPRGRRLRGASSPPTSARGTPSAWPTAPTRSRSRCARSASAPATRSSSPPSPSTPPPRRSPTRARGPCSATSTRRPAASPPRPCAPRSRPRTSAVLAVHLFGNVAPVAEIEALGVPVVEDAAQSAGSLTDAGRPGALGTLATFSFFPSKNLALLRRRRRGHDERRRSSTSACGCCASTARSDKSTFELVGHNSRLDELQAAILRVLLPHLDAWSDGRRAGAAAYERAGLGELVELPRATAGLATRVAPVRRARRARSTRSPSGAARRGHRPHGPTTASPCTASPRWPSGAPASSCPATEEAARTQPRDPDEPRADRRAGRRRSSARCGPRASSTNRLLADAPQDPPAALPVHRHSLPQIAGGRGAGRAGLLPRLPLRFDGGVPEDYQQLFEHTLSFVVIGGVFIFARLRPLPALDALLVAARVPAHRPGRR